MRKCGEMGMATDLKLGRLLICNPLEIKLTPSSTFQLLLGVLMDRNPLWSDARTDSRKILSRMSTQF